MTAEFSPPKSLNQAVGARPKSHRILMVDEDVPLRAALGLMLTHTGYEVSHANNGKEAIAMHSRNPFDLVIAEIVLPEKDGLEMLMQLRKQPPLPKFIAMSGESRSSAGLFLRIAAHLGAHCVLSKPFPPEQLLAAVRKVLDEV